MKSREPKVDASSCFVQVQKVEHLRFTNDSGFTKSIHTERDCFDKETNQKMGLWLIEFRLACCVGELGLIVGQTSRSISWRRVGGSLLVHNKWICHLRSYSIGVITFDDRNSNLLDILYIDVQHLNGPSFNLLYVSYTYTAFLFLVTIFQTYNLYLFPNFWIFTSQSILYTENQ